MTPSKNKGFTLLETLIAFVVLTVGLLGAVALQAQAKQASYDSLQRAAALNLANDIIGRITANDTAAAMALYNTDIHFATPEDINNSKACLNSPCTDVALANFDIQQWLRAIKANEGTGTLSRASICITPTIDQDQVNLNVTISWVGRQNVKQSTANTKIICGSDESNRKIVSINSFIFMRPVS